MQRYLALLLALIPISLAVFGIKLMRDCIRDSISSTLHTLVTILIGALCFALGFYILAVSSYTETVNEIKYKLALEDRKVLLFINKNETACNGLIFLLAMFLPFQDNQ